MVMKKMTEYPEDVEKTAANLARDIMGEYADDGTRSVIADALMAERESWQERFDDKVDGLQSDLDSAVEVAFKLGATEWVRLNYPDHYARLSNPSSEKA